MATVTDHSGCAHIVVDENELYQRGSHGLEVATVEVTRPDGKVQRFYVKLFLQKSVKCQVSASRVNLPQDVRASVTGSWFAPRGS
jgi:hypothetical protein